MFKLRLAPLATFVVWALAAAGALFWGLRLFSPNLLAPPHARAVTAVTPPPALASTDLSRLLGADEAPAVVAGAPAPAAPSDPRFQLLGVAAPTLALIAVDGKAPRSYRLGSPVAGDTVLRAVHARGADLGPRGGAVTMSLQVAQVAQAAPAATPPVNLPPGMAAPPPVMPTSVPPGRTLPNFNTGPRGQPRVPYGAGPANNAAQQPQEAPMVQNQAVTDTGAQNPAADPSQPMRRRNLPADALR